MSGTTYVDSEGSSRSIRGVFFLIEMQVDGENFDEFMKELGVGMVMRMAAKGVKPRLIIAENDKKWSIKSESTFKTVSYDFTPGVEFNETTPDGRELVVR